MDGNLKKKWKSKTTLHNVLSGLLPALELGGFIVAERRALSTSRGNTEYLSYSLTAKGNQWRNDRMHRSPQLSLILPVPTAVRMFEKEKQDSRNRLEAELAADNVDLQNVPTNVFEDAEGEGKGFDDQYIICHPRTIKKFTFPLVWLKWHRTLKEDRLRGISGRFFDLHAKSIDFTYFDIDY